MARMRGVLIVVVLIVVAGLIGGCSYNRFTTQDEAVKGQWAQVENQLQRRSDLIPNLVETVKGFAQQERDVFQAVADARAKMAGAQTPSDKIEAANQESSALSRLLVVVEAYPQLKSDANFARLMDELEGTENRLGTAADALQRAGAGVQHDGAPVPGQSRGGDVRLQGRPVLRAASGSEGAPEGGLQTGQVAAGCLPARCCWPSSIMRWP